MPPSRTLPDRSANSWPSPRQFTGSRWLDPGIISSCARMLRVRVEQRDDAGVAPEVGDQDLQSGRVGAVAPDALGLRMAQAQLLEKLAARGVEASESLRPSRRYRRAPAAVACP